MINIIYIYCLTCFDMIVISSRMWDTVNCNICWYINRWCTNIFRSRLGRMAVCFGWNCGCGGFLKFGTEFRHADFRTEPDLWNDMLCWIASWQCLFPWMALDSLFSSGVLDSKRYFLWCLQERCWDYFIFHTIFSSTSSKRHIVC